MRVRVRVRVRVRGSGVAAADLIADRPQLTGQNPSCGSIELMFGIFSNGWASGQGVWSGRAMSERAAGQRGLRGFAPGRVRQGARGRKLSRSGVRHLPPLTVRVHQPVQHVVGDLHGDTHADLKVAGALQRAARALTCLCARGPAEITVTSN